MPAIEIKPGVYCIGVDDRLTDLFEGLWPISREGISYNSYLINDEKKVIIDLAKSFKTDEFFSHVNEVVNTSQIDFVVINHMEPDHTGVLRTLKKISPHVLILGSEKTKEMLGSFYDIKENIRVVHDGEEISLGKKTLRFISTPFVHWPETIMTYDISDRILFSGDGFGGYGALGPNIFDDESSNIEYYVQEALRYFVNVIAKFSHNVLNAINKLASINVEIVAPSHGRVWRKDPRRIIELYKKWAGYAAGKTENGVTLVYGSMYGNTEAMMNAVARGITQSGVPLEIFDAGRTHVSYILPSLWTKRGVMVGAPTYEVELFPPVADVLQMALHKRIFNKKTARFGSYGWSGGGQKHFENIIKSLQWELVDSFEFIGGPTNEDFAKGFAFGLNFGNLIKSEK